MKTHTLSRLVGLLLAVLAPVLQAQIPTQGQWNVNNSGVWFNTANWLNVTAPSGAGSSAMINQDFGPGRMIGDFTQTATGTGSATAQVITLTHPPVNGTIGVTDGTFFWSQARGANSTAWTVTYNGSNQVSVAYTPAVTAGRTLVITYATTAAPMSFNEVVAVGEQVGGTDGVKTSFTRVLAYPPDATKMGVTDGTYYWHSATGVSSDNAFVVSYNATSRSVTVTYDNVANAPNGRNIVIVYWPAGTQGTYSVAVNTLGSGEPVKFTRVLNAEPVVDSNFSVASGGFSWTNGVNSNPINFTVDFTGPRTIVGTYRNNAGLTSLATGTNGVRNVTASFTTAAAVAKNVTLGNLFMGDISGADRVDLRLNSLTLDNKDEQVQINKIIGGPDEIAGNITLDDTLALAVRTGGDVASKNSFLLSANISGAGNVVKLDSGNVVLSGNNTYSGFTSIRNTGGTVFLNSAVGNAINSQNLFLGNASRDGHTSVFLQLSGANQLADNTSIWFDGASGRNPHLKLAGFSDTIAGFTDYTGQGVIENTQDESDFNTSSVLTVNSSNNYSFNGTIRNKNSAASAGTIGLTKQGTGTQTLSGNSINYSGPTIVSGGTLVLQNISGQGNLPYNPQSQTNGAVSTGGAYGAGDVPRFRSNIANTGNVELSATVGWTFGNVISGTGTLKKTGSSNLRITNGNTYSGATTVSDGTLTLTSGVVDFATNAFTDYTTAADNNGDIGGAARLQAIYGHGALTNTTAMNLLGGTLNIANGQNRTMLAPGTSTPTTIVFNQANRVNDSAPINSAGGTINFTHTHAVELPAASYAETLGALNVQSGRTQISTSQAATGATSKLTFNSISRTTNGTVHFSGNDLSLNTRNEIAVTTAPTVYDGIIGGWATMTTINPVDNSRQLDFVKYSGGMLQALALADYTNSLSGTTNTEASWRENHNVRINGNSPDISSISGSTNLPRTINSLKFDDTTARTLILRKANINRTMVIDTGGLISRGANHIIDRGFLTAGAAGNYELLPWVERGRTLTQSALNVIEDNKNITATTNLPDSPVKIIKSGEGILQLFGANTHTGGTTINEGVVEIKQVSAFGPEPAISKPDYLTLNGGTVEGPTVAEGSNLNIVFEPKMGITLGAQGGFFSLKNDLTVRIKSPISGPGALQMGGVGIGVDSSGGVLELSGSNSFLGAVNVTTGTLRIASGTNTFLGPVNISAATLELLNGASWPTTKPTVAINGGEFKLGASLTIEQLTGTGSINSAAATDAVTLIIDQETNSTFTGTISESERALSLEKRGKGTLILNNSDDPARRSGFRGSVNIAEGVLQVNLLSSRGVKSALGRGDYDANVSGGQAELALDQKSASNLIIANGAALSFAGKFPQQSNRPFTIGVGDVGASLLANSTSLGNTITFKQGELYDEFFESLTPVQYDTIAFSSANQNAVFNLGGRNQGTNRFFMDLHDNGTGVLSVNKTGDGQWILGEQTNSGVVITTPSRNTYTGRTTIYLGTLGVQQNGVFGAAGGDAVTLVGGNLDLRNVDYAVEENLSMAGGRLRAMIGNSAWKGGVSLDVISVLEVGTGASLKLRGPVSGRGALTKVGFGTLTLENQSSSTGTFDIQEGILRLDYSNNTGSKLPDNAALVLGGGREGATLDLVGGGGANIVEIINNMNVRLGLNRITRSDPLATGTIVRLNSLPDFRIAQGAALDFGASGIAQTDRLNNAAGLLGSWATINKTGWAVSAASGIDIPITALASYTANTWGGVNSNTDVTVSSTITASSTTNTLRFNQSSSNVLTLEGDSLLKSGGILVTPNTGASSNVIAGGRLVLENNILGGSLNVHQHGTASALTINSEIANSVNPGDMTGNMYRDAVNNRFRAPGANDGASANAVIAANLYAGMPITGTNLEPGTVISSIDYNNGNITFNQGRTADVGVSITIVTTTLGTIALTGDTMVAGVQNRIRVFGTAEQLNAILSGNPISGGITGVIPADTIVTGKTLDNKDAPTVAILTINKNVPVPALTPLTLSFQSRNGVAKFGDGRLVLGGANTFTGPVFINGGVLSVTQLTNSGVAGPLGAGTSLATNLQISSAVLEYVGNSVVTDRGFTINEVGSVEIARSGTVADFIGNLSGGVGAALGTLEKAGEGTLKITRVLGNTDSPLSTATLPFTAATVGTGGATNFGGFTVRNGKLQLAYENPNSNENTNRFAASTAAVTMAGGTLELVGMSAVDWPGDTTEPRVSSPSENRVQQFLGQFTVNSGSSEVIVTGGNNTTTTLNLQDPNNPTDIIRQSGGTVHFVENPNGGSVAITLSIPSFDTSVPLPWATYKDTSQINRNCVNDFAAIETVDDGVINADTKNLYAIQPDVSQWPTNQPISEGVQPFSGTTGDFASVYLLRFFNKQQGLVNISGSLTLSGGAILVGTNVGDTLKRIEGGVLTSDDPYTLNTTSDLIIHNYNPSRAFEIASTIVDASKPVSLVHVGDGTTQLLSNNGYTGTTYLNGGVLRLSSALALPGGVGVSGGISNLVLNGGLLGLESDFTRPLGTGPEAVQFTGGGGFTAYGATRTVNFGGANAVVQWGQGGFVARGGSLLFSSYDADATVRVSNPINLGATYRQVDVADGSAVVDAELTGVLSGVGASIAKLGQGTLRVTAANTFTGGTTLAQGNLLLGGAGLGNIDMGTVNASVISDAITLQFDSGSSVARLTVGNQNSKGISTIKISGNSTVTNGVDLQRDVFVDAAAGRTLNINGTSSGTGRIRVNEGGAVSFNGTGNFGSAGGVQGAAIDGGVVVRNGIVMVGGDSGLGTSNIELGDQSSSFSVVTVDRSTAGRSVLKRAGEYLELSSGRPDDVKGTGAFVYVDQTTLTIDGQVYGKADAAVVGVIGSVGKRILVNGESEHPERNGIYELLYSDGDTFATTDDYIGLRRVTAFDDQTEHNYGARIAVQSGAAGGSDAGKVFFLATTKPGSLPPAVDGRVLVTTPVFWKQDVSANPNVSLLAAAAGLTIPNTVDINNTNGSGVTTLGGSVNFISGSSTFTGNVQFQGQVPTTVETKTLRLTSDSLSGRGAEFSGVISEADSLDSLSLVKVGAGIVTLRGENTYKGGTQVNSGTLLVNNSAGSGTGTGSVTVSNFGSALGGKGSIAGATSLLNGAALLPGDPTLAGGVESLSFGSSLTLGADASLWLQWTSPSIADADKLEINGLFTADATAVIKILLEFVPLNAMTFDFIDWGSISASGGLADRLDLPALASSTLFWDTSSFSSTGELAISVRNTSGPPPVHFSIREATAREDVGTVRIAVELDWTPPTNVTVPILTSGSATIGAVSDYTLSTTSMELVAGQRSQELVITVRDDAASESTEKITLTIGTPTGAIKGSPTSFTLTIIDNDGGLPLADRWDLRNPLPTNETFSGLALVDSTLVAVGTKGGIFSSTDGVAWTKRPLPVGMALNSIASNSSTFVAVGENGNLVTSANGTDWVIRSVGGGKTLT
ncbi:MAG: autotransporter-associated beta strand repeat-containing protein, partial [Verrucomicrobiaceae bacterium]